MLRHLSSAAAALLMAAVLTGCGDDGITLPDERAAAAIGITGGDDQSATVGTALAQPIEALVTDSRGAPVVDQRVEFTVSGGGAPSPAAAQTNANGVASTTWTLGTTAGIQTLTARPTGNGAADVSATAQAVATAGAAASIEAVSGSPQSAIAGTTLASPLVVRVRDQFGNGVPGVAVEWTTTGGGSVSDSPTTTDGDGEASVIRTLGPSTGAQATQASVDGLDGSPVTFAATATAGTGATIAKIAGDNQQVQVSTVVPIDPRVRVTDANGNGVAGVTVNFAVTSGGGTVTGAAPVTNSAGEAAVTSWQLGSSAGTNTLSATAAGAGTVVFTATAQAGSGSALAFVTAPPSTVASGGLLSPAPVLQVVDAQGNPVGASGIPITVSISSGGTLSGTTTRTTDSNGRVSLTGITASGLVGTYTLTFSGQGTPLTRSLSITAGATSQSQSSVQLSPSTVSAGSATTVTVTAKDAAGNPISGASVSLSTEPGPGTFGDASLTTAGNGTASTTFTPGATGTQTISATITGAGGPVTVSAQLTVQAAATTTTITDHTPNPSTRGQQVTVEFSVTASSGTPVGTVNVTSTEGASCQGTTASGECVLTFNTAGTWTITATYAGGGSFAGSSDSEQHQVNPAESDVVITGFSVEPAIVGEPVSVTFSVTSGVGTPSGSVTVTTAGPSGPGDSCQADIAAGSCQLTLTSAGDYVVTATYAGSAEHGGDAATRGLTVVVGPGEQGSPSGVYDIEIRRQPSPTAKSGQAFTQQPEVRIRNQAGNNVSGLAVSVELASGTGTLAGRTTDVTRPNGVGSWDDLRIVGAGPHTLRFLAGSDAVVSDAIFVTP